MQFLHMSEAIVREGKEVVTTDRSVRWRAIWFVSAGDQIYRMGSSLEGELKVDESQLTGEADEVKRAQDALMSDIL